VSLFAIAFVFYLVTKINKMPVAKGKAIEITKAVQEGAMSYLKRQYKTIGMVAVVLFFAIWIFFGFQSGAWVGFGMALSFLIGAFLSGLSGFVGMLISTQANTRVAESARKGMGVALDLAFKCGLVTGLLVVSFGLLAVSCVYFVTSKSLFSLEYLIALGFGASLISVFARIGGGIYTKAADVGADLVGKVEKNIPEDCRSCSSKRIKCS